jgi:hypothetical protein
VSVSSARSRLRADAGRFTVTRSLDFHQLHDGGDIVGQVLVIGLVGDETRDVIGGRDRNRPQQQQRRQHPVEDFAEQRIRVLEIDEGIAGPASCRKRREPPLALRARRLRARRAGVRL